MIDAQLGPPPAVASRGSTAPQGGPDGIAPAAHPEAEHGSFGKALENKSRQDRETTPSPSETRTADHAAHTDTHAAGPRKGELQEDAADAGASQKEDQQTAAAGIAAAIATVVSAVIPVAAPATPPSGAIAGVQAAEVAQAAPPQPLAGLVPAALDGKGGVVPAAAPAQGQAQAGTAAAATTSTALPAAATPAGPAPSAAPAAGTAPAAAAPVATDVAADAEPAAAVITLTLTPAPPKDGAAGTAGGVMATPAATTATPAAAAAATPDVPAPAAAPAHVPPAAQDAPRATATTAEPPAGAIAPAPVQQPAAPDPLGGIVRPNGGLTTPHELARELGERVHMAVREGGRELVLNLRPAELGHLTIRVVMHEGVMQASIVADRPEAARMLQQSMGHLDAALGDLGYSLGNLDVAYNGQDAQDARSSSQGNDSPVTGEVLEADGTPAVSGPTTRRGATTSSQLDILA